jgi:hypothetical protein
MSTVREDTVQDSVGIRLDGTGAVVRALGQMGRRGHRITYGLLLSELGHARVRTAPTEAELFTEANTRLLAAARERHAAGEGRPIRRRAARRAARGAPA